MYVWNLVSLKAKIYALALIKQQTNAIIGKQTMK